MADSKWLLDVCVRIPYTLGTGEQGEDVARTRLLLPGAANEDDARRQARAIMDLRPAEKRNILPADFNGLGPRDSEVSFDSPQLIHHVLEEQVCSL